MIGVKEFQILQPKCEISEFKVLPSSNSDFHSELSFIVGRGNEFRY
jgi:hypothetical protein